MDSEKAVQARKLFRNDLMKDDMGDENSVRSRLSEEARFSLDPNIGP